MAVSINHLTSNVTLQVTQPYLVVDDEGLKAFAVGIQGPPSGSTVALAGLTDVDDAAVPTNRFFVVGDGTKFVTRGILGDDLPVVPLAKGGTGVSLVGAGLLDRTTSSNTAAAVVVIDPNDAVSARQLSLQTDIAADIPGVSFVSSAASLLPTGADICGITGFGGYIFACDRFNNNVYSFIQAAGVLTLVSTLFLGVGVVPCNLVVDPSGNFLYILNNSAATIQSVAVSSGVLTLNGSSVAVASTLPQALTIDPSGNYLYVGSGIAGAGVIQTFPITAGAIGAATSSVALPYPYAITCKSGFLYALTYGTQGTGCNVQPYTITSGVLTPDTPVAANIGGASCIAINPAGDKLIVGGGATSPLPALGDDRVRYRQIAVSLLSITAITGVPVWRTNATAITGDYGPVGISFDATGANAYTSGVNGAVRWQVSGFSVSLGGYARATSTAWGQSYYFAAIFVDPATGYIYAGNTLDSLIPSTKSPIINLHPAIGGTGAYTPADARFTMGLPNFTLVGQIGYCAQSGTVGVATTLNGNTTTTKQFLSQTGTGTISAAPVWSVLTVSDMPTGGTSGQFLRGDKTYSNTLTGGLTISGALAGATTGAFSGAVTLSGTSKIIYGAAGTTNAAQNEIVGTSTGLKSNVASGSYHEFLAGGSRCAQFGRGGLGVSGAGRFSLGAWGTGATYDDTQAGIDATTNSIIINTGTSGQFQVWNSGSANSILRIGYTSIDGGVSSVNAWAMGKFGTTSTVSQAGIASSGDGSLTVNVTSVNGAVKLMAQGVLRRSQTAIGGVIIADLGAPVVLANSTTTTLMTATNRYGRLELFDNTGQWATIRVANAATPVLEASSANFAITASPTASQLGINLSAGSLQIITGSAAGTTVSANFRGM